MQARIRRGPSRECDALKRQKAGARPAFWSIRGDVPCYSTGVTVPPTAKPSAMAAPDVSWNTVPRSSVPKER